MFDGVPLANPERMAPPGRLRRGQRSRIGRNALASLLFHALLLVGFIEWSGRERPAEPLPPPALDVELMQAGNERGPTAPELAEVPTLDPPADPTPPSEPAPRRTTCRTCGPVPVTRSGRSHIGRCRLQPAVTRSQRSAIEPAWKCEAGA